MWEKMDAYKEKFGEQFPLMLVRDLDEAGVVALIDNCLQAWKPYSPELEKDADY
jgi:hypothetical protein